MWWYFRSPVVPRAIDRDAIYRRRRFNPEDIELCVRWYITYRLSYRDLVAMMAERGVVVTHTTIMRWVVRYVPVYIERWDRWAKPVGRSWRVDETAISVRGQKHYLYRAVDKSGKTVASMLSDARTTQAAEAFFRKAVRATGSGWPEKINLDQYHASHKALRMLGEEDTRWRAVLVRGNRYLNNIVEQDHRAVKQRCASMLGFKSAERAAVTLEGIELAHRIRKRQFDMRTHGTDLVPGEASLKHLWAAALATGGQCSTPNEAEDPLTHQNSIVPFRRKADPSNQPRRIFPTKVCLGRGLYLHHMPNGSTYWRLRYRYERKCKNLALGHSPYVSIEMARAMQMAARRMLAAGLDPGLYKHEVRQAARPLAWAA